MRETGIGFSSLGLLALAFMGVCGQVKGSRECKAVAAGKNVGLESMSGWGNGGVG